MVGLRRGSIAWTGKVAQMVDSQERPGHLMKIEGFSCYQRTYEAKGRE